MQLQELRQELQIFFLNDQNKHQAIYQNGQKQKQIFPFEFQVQKVRQDF